MLKKITAIFSILFIAWALQASAHAELVSSTPKQGETVNSSIKDIQITFGERVEKFLSLTLKNRQGKTFKLNKPDIRGKKADIPVKASLPTGAYTLKWKVLSIDGHSVSQSLTFNIQSTKASVSNNAASKKKSKNAAINTIKRNQDMVNNQVTPVIVMFVIGIILIIATAIFFARRNRRN